LDSVYFEAFITAVFCLIVKNMEMKEIFFDFSAKLGEPDAFGGRGLLIGDEVDPSNIVQKPE
jgi:hypothetical protein